MASIHRELCAAAATNRASPDSLETIHPCSAEDVFASLRDSSHDASTPAADIDAQNSADFMLTVDGSGIEAPPIETSQSIPVILHRVLTAEFRDLSGPDVLLILAVHAVMLETGFVVWNATVEGSGVPAGWFRQGTVDLHYTLPGIVHGVEASDVGHVILRCQTLGQNVVIYGTISGETQLPTYRRNLQTSKCLVGTENETSVDPSVVKKNIISSFSDLFGLWKGVKDGLSLPLLTALCERAGFPVPLSLLRFPFELKVKILECLSGSDLSMVGCTCSELRHLSANDELWKRLFLKEFGSGSGQKPPLFRGWKDAFRDRLLRRRRVLEGIDKHVRLHYGISSGLPFYRGFPRIGRITGGDCDIYPIFGNGPFRGGLGGVWGP